MADINKIAVERKVNGQWTGQYDEYDVEDLTARQGGGSASALSDLSDVGVFTPLDGESLIYNFTNQEWTSGSPALGGLSDTSLRNPPRGALLSYDTSNYKWKADYLAYNTADSKGGRNYLKNLKINAIYGNISGDITKAEVINGELHVTGNGGYVIVDFDAPPGEYILSVGVNLGTLSATSLYPYVGNIDNSWIGHVAENGTLGSNGNEDNVTIYTGYSHQIEFYFYEGTYTDVVFKPMLRLSNDSNSNYEPPINEMKIYSTDERKIGYWIDGSDLYAKTIKFNYEGNDNLYDIYTDISSLDVARIWIHDGYFYKNDEISTDPLNLYSDPYYVSTSLTKIGGGLSIVSITVDRNTTTAWKKGYVTLYYTKES